eukprot:UC4_evm2s34
MNPMFANFHRVLLWYCDGASFAGSVKNPIINTTGTGKNVTLWFRGQEVLNSQLNYLIEKFSLGKAENVLVTGCSAGGMATYLQADKVCKIVANPRLKKCKAAALSGFFLDHKNVYGIPKAHIQYEYIMRMQNMSGGVNQNCILKGASSCATPQQNYAFVTTPFFVMNSMLDLYQMENILEVGCKNLAQCNRSEISNIIEYQQDFRRTITSIKTLFKPGNGAFLDNCMIHCGEQDSTGFNNFAVPLADGGDRIVMRDALSKWWNATEGDLAENHIYIENCEIQGPQPCNPSCGSTYNFCKTCQFLRIMEFPLPIFDKSSKPTSIAQAPSDNMSLLPGPWLGLYGNFPRPKPKRRRKGDPLPTSVSSTTSICSKYPKKRTDRPACVNTIDEDDDDVFSSAEDLFTSALDVPTTNSSPSSGKNFSSLASTDQLDRFEALGKSPLAPSKSSKNESTPTPSSSRQGPWLGLAVPVPTLDQLSQHWSKSADRTESSQPEEMHPVNNVPRSISNPFTESTLSNDTLFSAESLNSKVEFQPSARSYSNDNIDVVKRLLALQRQKKMDFSTDSTM